MGMIVIANTKGGSGKSTSAMHLIAPWLLSRTGSAHIVEIDDQNTDTEGYANSDISTECLKMGDDSVAHYVAEKVIEKSYLDRIILDLGGNKTCDTFLRNLSNAGAGDDIDMFVVPVSGAGQDVINADKTIEFIKKEMPDFNGPILVVVTRSATVEPELVERELPEIFDTIEEYDVAGPIVLPQSRLFSGARGLGRSAWEVGRDYDLLMADIKKAKAAAKKKRDIQDARLLSRLNSVIVAGRQWHEYLNEQFAKLDQILPLEEASAQQQGSEESASEKNDTKAE